MKEGLPSWMIWERSRRRMNEERGEYLTLVDEGEIVVTNLM